MTFTTTDVTDDTLAARPDPIEYEGAFRSYVRLYATLGRTSIMEQFQYRVANYLYMVGMVAEPVVYLVVWSTIARQQGGSVGGYTAGTFAAYYIVWTLVRNMNIVFTPFGWEARIREGRLSGQLVQPIHPIHHDLGFFAGWKVVVIVLWIPLAVALSLIFRPELDPTAAQIGAFLVAIWGAYLIRSLLLWMLGMVTFWTTRVSALFEAFFAAELLLSGRLLPISLMPEWAQTAASFLPFESTFGFPITALVGPISTGELVAGLLRQLVWIALGTLGVRVMWRSALRLHGGERVSVAGKTDRAIDEVRLGGVRLALLHLRIGVMNELQYRANLVIQMIQSLVAIGTGLVVLALIFDRTDQLDGWSRPQLLVVMGVFTLVGGVIGFAIEPNMGRVMADVEQGTFDYVLTKPVDSQLLASIREFRLWRLTDAVVGVAVIVWGVVALDQRVGPAELAGFVLTLAAGSVLIYCLWLVLTSGAFWFTRMHMIQELFTGLYRAGQYPVTIYPLWLRASLTYLIPIGFAVTVPSEALTGRLTLERIAVTAVFVIAAFITTRIVWQIGTRRYSGASA